MTLAPSRIPSYQSWPVVLGITLAVTALRIMHLAPEPYSLFVDESQYWSWAQALDWGYYSKPPMIAWVIALTTALCGDGESCVKLASPLAYMLATGAVYMLARQLFDRGIAFWSALLFLTLPGISLSATLISTDPILLLFWSCGLLCAMQAVQVGKLRWWLLTGLIAGLGLLTKYTFLFFGLSLLLWLAHRGELRTQLRRAPLWMGGAVALLVSMPNIVWNMQHDFITLQHTGEISHLQHAWFNLDHLGDFVAGQAGMIGPLLFLILLWCCIRPSAMLRDPRYAFLYIFIMPILASMTVLSFLGKANANWSAPAYVTGTILVAAWACQHRKRWVIVLSLLLHGAAAGVLYNYNALARYADIPLTRSSDPFFRMRGWRELGQGVAQLQAEYPDAAILTLHRRESAAILYYARHALPAVIEWNADGHVDSHYQLTTSMNTYVGKDFIVIHRGALPPSVLNRFQQVEPLAPIDVSTEAGELPHYRVYYAHHFKGYAE